MAKFPVKDLSIAVSVTVLGVQIELDFVPFKFAKPDLRTGGGMLRDPFSFHLFAGPFHLWSMSGLSATLGAELKIGRNPFHGQPLIPKRKTNG